MEMPVYSNCLQTVSQPNISYELYIMENCIIKSVQVTTFNIKSITDYRKFLTSNPNYTLQSKLKLLTYFPSTFLVY